MVNLFSKLFHDHRYTSSDLDTLLQSAGSLLHLVMAYLPSIYSVLLNCIEVQENTTEQTRDNRCDLMRSVRIVRRVSAAEEAQNGHWERQEPLSIIIDLWQSLHRCIETRSEDLLLSRYRVC